MELTPVMQGKDAEALMRELSSWGNVTTIILQGSCVFEFKGIFPRGDMIGGYFNLKSGGAGFEGHIKLDAIDRIVFQSGTRRGRESHAFVFQDKDANAIFKVFLGRDADGNLLLDQVKAFKKIQTSWMF